MQRNEYKIFVMTEKFLNFDIFFQKQAFLQLS